MYQDEKYMENMEETIIEVKPNKKNKIKGLGRFMATAAMLGLVVGFGYLTFQYEGNLPEAGNSEIQKVETVNGNGMDADALSTVNSTNLNGITSNVIDVSNIVEAALPSVVAVNCVTYKEVGNGFMFPFYPYQNSGSVTREESSCGTGIIIGKSDEELLILTNNHVVEGADRVSAVFVDDNEVEGKVLGSDADADLAVISVKLSDMSPETTDAIRIAAMGDSDTVKVGEAAIAIGNALGYGQSVTTGVISALNRDVNLVDKTMTLLQTDAAINGGNSGGPLLNARGEVIGINTVKYASTGVEGMGYAIPITNAKPIIEEIINGSRNEGAEEAQSAYLGIYGLDVTEQHQTMYGMPAGVYVYQVEEGSPAQKYNLSAGSIITAIDGSQITNMEELSEKLEGYQPGSSITVTLKVPARGQYMEASLTIVLGAKAE